MKIKFEYLTDAELESMICELEQNELVSAPPDLQLEILEKQEKILAYKRYRLQVLTTVAAAVLAVFWFPGFESRQQAETDFFRPLQIQGERFRNGYLSREDDLNDGRMLETVLGGVNIFADNSRFHLFKE